MAHSRNSNPMVYLVDSFDSLHKDNPSSTDQLPGDSRYDMLVCDRHSNRRIMYEGGKLLRDLKRRIVGLEVDQRDFSIYVAVSSRTETIDHAFPNTIRALIVGRGSR